MSRGPIPSWYFALVVARCGHRFLLTQGDSGMRVPFGNAELSI